MAVIDVVVPCYNYGRFLPRCVASLRGQTLGDFRVLVIDDASTDDSAAIARQIATQDERFEAAIHPVNQGHIATYNEGIAWSSSEYLLLLSADDLLPPHALERAVSIMRRDPRVVLTYGAAIDVAPGQELPVLKDAAVPWRVRPGVDFIAEACASTHNHVPTPTAIVRTGAQKRAGFYRAALTHSGDLEMWLRLASLGAVAETKAVQAFKGVHGVNMSLVADDVLVRDYLQREAAFDSFFENEGGSVPGAADLHRRARLRLAELAFWTGVAQLARGNKRTGQALLAYACRLRPVTPFLPPLHALAHIADVDRRIADVAGAVAKRIGRRTSLAS